MPNGGTWEEYATVYRRRFAAALRSVEQGLRELTGADPTAPFEEVVQLAVTQNRVTEETARRLLHFAGLRDSLDATTSPSEVFHLTQEAVEDVEQIDQQLGGGRRRP